MLGNLFGVGLALAAALSNAASKVFVRKGTDTGRSDDVILVVSVVNLVVVVPLALVVHWGDLGLTPRTLLAFAAAGIISSLCGRVLNFKSIERIGASRTVPIVSAHAAVAVITAMVFLGERPRPLHILGVLLVVAGAATVSWETSRGNPQNLSRRELLVGLLFPIGAATFYGIEPTVSKVGLDGGTPPLVGLAVRVSVSLVAFTAFLVATDRMPTRESLRRDRANWQWYVGAGVLNTGFLLGYYAALSVTSVSVVAPLLPTDVLFTLVLSAVWLPRRLETVTWKLVTAALVVVAGVVIISTFA